MENFLQTFAQGLDDEGHAASADESPATRVNVVFRSARRFVASPGEEQAHFENELEAFELGLGESQATLEALFDHANEAEELLLETAHGDLGELAQVAERLEGLLDEPSGAELDLIAKEMLVPTYRLLLAREALEFLGSRVTCPYCEADNPRDATRCEGCGKALKAPDPLAQKGELFPVPPSITKLLQLCFLVAGDPDEQMDPWQEHLATLRTQFSLAQGKVQKALKTEPSTSPNHREFGEMNRGIEIMLAGFEEMRSYSESRDPAVLDTGWVNMMSGFKMFKQAGDRIASASNESP